MTNLKTTKRALLSSVIALLLCFTMFLGTTFAWFTDLEEAKGKLSGDGRILLRKSGTEPVIRVMVEAKGENLCLSLAEKVAEVITQKY